MRRTLTWILLAVYCMAIYLALDFLVSNFAFDFVQPTQRHGKHLARTASAIYHHGLVANADTYEMYGEIRYRLITNSLGFKDGSTRTVPLKADARRILLIGDSFTEGLGAPYEDTFTAMLNREAVKRGQKIEFLNAAAVSYSPVIYYRKIKLLLESGLSFDEVIVFSDLSDVFEEATSYFCVDEHPEYRAHCNPDKDVYVGEVRKANFWSRNFAVTDSLRVLIKTKIQTLGGHRGIGAAVVNRSAWVVPDYDIGDQYAPLGIEGGVARSLKNMQALADLLAARNIPLTVVVYPWPMQLDKDQRTSRQVDIWRDFCARACKAFVNLYAPFFAVKDAHSDWYPRLFILGDSHFNRAGNVLIAEEMAKHVFGAQAK